MSRAQGALLAILLHSAGAPCDENILKYVIFMGDTNHDKLGDVRLIDIIIQLINDIDRLILPILLINGILC